MQNIEEYIGKNQDVLSDEKPKEGHEQRFLNKLRNLEVDGAETWYSRNGTFVSLAAVVILFIGIGTFYYTTGFSGLSHMFSKQIASANLPAEVQQVFQYYNAITNQKVEQINVLASSDDQAVKIKAMAQNELNTLETDREDLEREYARNPNNERVVDALLINRQKQSEILDKILNSIQR